MDEKNNLENAQEQNDFVMEEPSIQPQIQPQPEAQPEMQQDIQQDTEQDIQQDVQQEAEQRVEQEAEPMPSEDNVYRFQNTNPQTKQKDCGKKIGVTKLILGAVIFGVVAAVCFFGVTQLLEMISGSNKIDTIENSASAPLQTVSGSAVGMTDVSGVVERVMPSIVSITEKSTQTSYFGQTYSSQGAGSGFIVKQDNNQLLVVTNHHVVANAESISVQFNDGEVADATVKGSSESTDLAVLTVPLKSLKASTKKSIRVASLGSSDDAKVGQMVIAIGNALGYGQSVTVGYLSAKDREVSAEDASGNSTTQALLQTDAAINPGNSGGALIDTSGNVIGINSSKYFSYGSTDVEGMGYAIPMSKAVTIINDLMDREVLKDNEKGYLGVTGRSISETVSETYGMPVGVYVSAVSDTGAAYKAGIKQGDVITKIDDVEVKTIEEVQEKVNNTKAGTKIQVTIMRSDDGEYVEKKVEVTLKGKDTLEGLEDDSATEQQQGTYEGSGDGSYGGNYGGNGGNGSQVIPWGGSIY